MIFSYLLNMQSHPSWVCGLKPSVLLTVKNGLMSHPSWVCGLKLAWVCAGYPVRVVTPFVGVWIETKIKKNLQMTAKSHPSWVCGLKLDGNGNPQTDTSSHPSWVCGLKRSVRLLQN